MRSFFNRLFFFIIAIVALSLLFLGFLPSILSTQWGKSQLESWLNHKIPGTVEIRALDLHWGKGQKIEGAVLRDPDGQSVLSFEKLYSDASLWQLIRHNNQLGFTHLKNLNTTFVTDQNGQSNLQKALGLNSDLHLPLPSSTISISDVQGNFYLPTDTNTPFTAHVKGITRQGNLVGSFEINFALNELNELDFDEWQENPDKILSSQAGKKAKIEAHIINFPIDILDQLMSLKDGKKTYFRLFLGEKLDLHLTKSSSLDALAFDLSILTPHLQGNFKGSLDNEIITLHEPSIFNLDLLPASINPLLPNQFKLIEPSQLELTMRELHLPLGFFTNSTNLSSCQYGFDIQTRLTPFQVDFVNVGSFFKINDFKILLSSPICTKEIKLSATGHSDQNNAPFELAFESILNKPENSTHFFEQLKQNMQTNLSVHHLPIYLFESNLPSALIPQIGASIDVQLEAKHIKNNQFVGSIALLSTNLTLEKTLFEVDKELRITKPASLNLLIQPTTLAALFESDKWTLRQAYSAQIKINQLVIPFIQPEKSEISFETSLPSIVFPHLTAFGELHLNHLHMNGNTKNQSIWQISVNGLSELLNSDQTPSPLLQAPINWTVNSLLKINPNGKFEIPSIKIKAEGGAIGMELDGQLNPDKVLTQNKPFNLYYRLTPQAFQEIAKNFNWAHAPVFQNTSSFELNIEPTAIDFKNDWLSKLLLKGTAHIDQVTFKENTDLTISLEKISMPVLVDARRNMFNVSLDGTAFTSVVPKPNHFSMELKIEQWLIDNKLDFDHIKMELDSHLIALPTALISRFFTDKDLTPLIGQSLDIELKTLIDREKHNSGYWDMHIDSPSLHGRTRLVLDDAIQLYASKNPAVICKLTLNPQGYEYLQKNILQNNSPLTLAEPLTITFHLSSLNMPFKFDASALEQGKFTAHLSTSELMWKEFPSIAPFKWEGKVESPALSKKVTVDLATNSAEDFSLSMNGLIDGLFDANSKLKTLDQTHVEFGIKASRLPVDFFQTINLLDGLQLEKFKVLWGDKINAQAHLQLQELNGPIQAEMIGTNGKAFLNGKITQGILYLEKPFQWSLKMTSQLGKTILSENAPFLNSITDSEQPVQLIIQPKNFQCPLFPFDLTKVSLDEGVIKAGKVNFLNQGELSKILSYLTPVNDSQITLWFTPIFFNLHEGQLQLQRFDILVAYLYTLAGWGKMDLKSHQFDLVLGLTAQSLNQAFAVQGLEDDYILQVPVKGRKGRVEIDKSKLIARISALIAQMKGGNKGKILGGLLEMAVSGEVDSTPPKPTTSPFPWAKEWQYKPKTSADSPTLEKTQKADKIQIEDLPKEESSKNEKKKKKSKNNVESFLQLLDKI